MTRQPMNYQQLKRATARNPAKKGTEKWMLFDMENDMSETSDVASQYPEITTAMGTKWGAWAEEVHAIHERSTARPLP